MRVILQRVSKGCVRVDNQVVGEIAHGYVALVGITHDDTREDVELLAKDSMYIFIETTIDIQSLVSRQANYFVKLVASFVDVAITWHEYSYLPALFINHFGCFKGHGRNL